MFVENSRLPIECALTIEGSRSLPASMYRDDDIFELEKTSLFFRTWQYACHISQLSSPGSYVTVELFDQQLVLIRNTHGEVNCFYNVCLHRGHPLVEGGGCKARLVCPYHAWVYDLDGNLASARRADSSDAIDRSGVRLTSVRVERVLDFYFVNLDPDAPPLSEVAGGLEDSLNEVVPDLSDYQLNPALDYVDKPFECNWKVLIDNQLECYHCDVAHPGFAKLMDIENTRNTMQDDLVLQHIPAVSDLQDPPFPYQRDGDVGDGMFWTLFPNTILARLPGAPSLSISRLQPISATRTTRVIQVLSHPGGNTEGSEERLKWLRDGVIEEDRGLCEAVQKGVTQRGFTQGYYAIDARRNQLCEEPVRYFHQRYLDALSA